MKKSLEIIAQNTLDAINTQKGGADRIELVSALSEGGLTPSIGMIESILNNISIDVAVMIRPMSQSFCYDMHYLDVMKKDISIMQKIGVSRLVLGMLDKNYDIDFDAMEYVLEDINIPVTFHRAIDNSKDILKNVEKLNKYEKVTHILTSGGYGKATDNIETIKKILKISNKRIIIGSGLKLESIDILKNSIDEDTLYDIHFGTYVQDNNGIVDYKKVSSIANKFIQ